MRILELVLPVVLMGTYVQCCGQQKPQRKQSHDVIYQSPVVTEHMINTNPCYEKYDFRNPKPGQRMPLCPGAGQKPLPSVNTTAAPGTVVQSGSGTYMIFNDTPEKDPPTLVRKQLESKQKASKKEK